MPKAVDQTAVIPAKRTKRGASPQELQTAGAPDSAVINLMQAMMTWEPVNLQDPTEVQNRISKYFNLCTEYQIRPGAVALAGALGISRQRLWEIKTGVKNNYSDKFNVPRSVQCVIQKAYITLESLWEYNMSSGKINPPCGIFLGKNLYGYQDVVDYNITPKADTSVLPSEDLQKRLESLPDE